MKLSRANCLKCGAVLLALALFTGSILIGGGRTGAAAPTPNPTAAAPQEATDDGSPQVESVSASPLGAESVFAAEGNARLLVRFSPEERVPDQIKTVIDDRDVILRDDGAGGDEVAGDGTFSAIVTIDFNALADNQDEIQLINSQPEPQPTVDEGEPTVEPSVDGEAAQGQDGPSANTAATVGTVTEEEAADTDLRSDDSVVMPDFESGRDLAGNKAAPLVDFRNLRPGQVVPLWRIGTHRRVDPARSLVITNVRVVEDTTRTFNPCTGAGNPNGPWTFKTLMTAMANQPVTGINPSTFVRRWLDKWMADQVVNGFTVAKRQQMQTLVIDPWVAASGGPHMPLDLNKAPFKLLAIVNRVDLRSNSVYGGGSAGEGRFVFGVIDRRPIAKGSPYPGGTAGCRPMQFTVIFEYGIDRRGCAIRDWGRQWYNLRNYKLGSSAYNTALQAITDQFTKANAAPHKPNRSALNQLRTNEVELLLNPPTNPVWELREFRIGGDPGVNPGHLEMATVKLTPDLTHNQTPLLTSFVNLNTPLILIEKHNVPLTFMSVNFLGGSSLAPRNPTAPVDVNTHWNNPQNGPFITNRQARHKFSLNTCNACHTGETNTVFTHIKPVAFGTEAGLSGFMNGIDPNTGLRPFKVVDPADGTPTRKFNEFRRRAIDLDKLVHSPCFFDIHRGNFPPVH